MKVEIKEGVLYIELPIHKQASKSGKTILVASSNGNKATTAQVDGKIVTVGLNAYISK